MYQHDFTFDPTYGYSKDDLLKVGIPETEPEDFCLFWENQYKENKKVPLNIEKISWESNNPDFDIFQVYFNTLNQHRVGAWLTVPKDPKNIKKGMISSHGYGGREGPDYPPFKNIVTLAPIAPGFHLSATENLPNDSSAHVIHGIEDKDNYLILPCVSSIWSSVDVLLDIFPNLSNDFYFKGGSFGGGLGALALPWEKRFVKAHLSVPTFGNHPIRLEIQCNGSGEAVRQYYHKNPNVVNVLRYYDAATAASKITIPVHVTPALFDPAVPPPGQFAVCNAIKNNQMMILPAGHFEYPGQMKVEIDVLKSLVKWFEA